MEFENIVTEEFLDYKSGFINGKNDVLNCLIAGIDFSEFDGYSSWYEMGYEDGYAFYLEYYTRNENMPLSLIVGTIAWDVVIDNFVSRVSNYNEKNSSKIPVLSLKIHPKKGIVDEEM